MASSWFCHAEIPVETRSRRLVRIDSFLALSPCLEKASFATRGSSLNLTLWPHLSPSGKPGFLWSLRLRYITRLPAASGRLKGFRCEDDDLEMLRSNLFFPRINNSKGNFIQIFYFFLCNIIFLVFFFLIIRFILFLFFFIFFNLKENMCYYMKIILLTQKS